MRISSLLRFGAVSTLDNPSFRADDPRAVQLMLDGKPEASGIRVTRDVAATCSPWYRGIDLLSDLVGKLPIEVRRRLPGGSTETYTGHDWQAALQVRTGPWHTPFAWRKLMTAWQVVEGNAYAYLDRERFLLVPMNPANVIPVIERDEETGIEQIWYFWGAETGTPIKYHADEIIHFKGLSWDGIVGVRLIDLVRESIGLSLAAKRHQSVSLRNSARPSIVLTFPTKLKDETKTRIAQIWQSLNSGDNANKVAVLDQGLGFEKVGFTAEEIQLIQTQEFSIVDIAGFLGLPPHKLGDRTRTGYNGLEQEDLSMLGDKLDPVIIGQEQELSDKLLTEAEKRAGDVTILADRERLVAMDSTARANFWRTALAGNPFAQVSDARAAFSWKHIEGTEYIPAPVNMTKGPGDDQGDPAPPAPKPAQPAPPTQPETQPSKATAASAIAHRNAWAWLCECASRLGARLGKQGEGKATKDGFAAWAADLEASQVDASRGEFRGAESAASDAFGVDCSGRFAAAALAAIAAAVRGGRANAAAADAVTAVSMTIGELYNGAILASPGAVLRTPLGAGRE